MKPRCSAAQLRELVQTRLQAQHEEQLQEGALLANAPNVGTPHGHPADALGRNWDIAQVTGLRRAAPVRAIIDSVREAFDLDDLEDAA